MTDNEKNIKLIQEEIRKKNGTQPYYTDYTIYGIMNDHDTFPYNKFYRGDVTSASPHVYERTAGWTPRKPLTPVAHVSATKPNVCFQSSCSIVYPCYSEGNNYYMLNKACVDMKR